MDVFAFEKGEEWRNRIYSEIDPDEMSIEKNISVAKKRGEEESGVKGGKQ